MRLWNSGNVPRRKVFIVIICSLLFVVILLSRGVYWTFKSYINVVLLSDEGPMLETLDHTIRIGSTPTFLYFDL